MVLFLYLLFTVETSSAHMNMHLPLSRLALKQVNNQLMCYMFSFSVV